MGKIQILNETVASRIAAGEVVERPASIVKELLENSIDAHATAIAISIEEGGVREIRVSDNGEGIAPEDMPLTVVKHATSKIFTLEDLEHIHSMGFRGEALASIAAVSMLTIKSRTKNAAFGSELYARGGRVESLRQAGLPDGTTVLVENLFYNTPARLKFLKKPGAEAALISDMVARLILANPQISFRYTAGGKVVYHSPGNGKLEDAIYSVYGFSMKNALIPVDFRLNQTYLRGYIGAPFQAYKTQKHGTLLVNGRYVKNSLVQRSVMRAYGERLLKNNYPFYVLQLTLPAEEVDVNVHPNKLAVHFRDENEVEYVLISALEQALRSTYRPPALELPPQKEVPPAAEKAENPPPPKPWAAPSLPEREESESEETELTPQQRGANTRRYAAEQEVAARHAEEEAERMPPLFAPPQPEAEAVQRTDSVLDPALSERIDEILQYAQDAALQTAQPLSLHESGGTLPIEAALDRSPPVAEETAAQAFGQSLSQVENRRASIASKAEQAPDIFRGRVDFRIVGVAFETYLIIEYASTLYLIDQHAAHERKIYDELMAGISKRLVTQHLLTPLRMEITPAEAQLLEENRSLLSDMGFCLARIDLHSCTVTAYPQILGDTDIRQTFQDMLGNLDRGEGSQQVRREKIAKGACKRAIKGGMRMSEADIRELVETSLMQGKIPHCPHGRPVAITLTRTQLEEGFKRRV